ncbi:uncharacterized protein Gasu_21320 [Galdieria sulphuraria]|uniref:Uncharacterized protein n=1 Tax=Galdieria sulphuraria TaxID=130081 RepID=M2W3Y8_GALSU|nr:uncharacterized protein Gasu_21320 [Galdieria sulphuraria]EME30456.1 hypothetical protein Gasu_21320 [Galdieria sulphuraria]|eukprot:XP_005706976.1 hypothetical protein Gasu_21320 [Galdieria sulphuraria]
MIKLQDISKELYYLFSEAYLRMDLGFEFLDGTKKLDLKVSFSIVTSAMVLLILKSRYCIEVLFSSF